MGNAESARRNSSNNAGSYPAGATNGSASAAILSTQQSSNGMAINAATGGQPNINGPGAFQMPGRPATQRFYVTIPRGVNPGQHFAVLVNGQQMMVRCPEENRPGDRLIVTSPRQNVPQQYVVTVPPNVKPSQQFRVMINNQEVMVTCPRGVRPGQRVTFQLPNIEQQRDPVAPAEPNHQMFEVIVPEGVRPNQSFALVANGQRVMVTCPPNIRPGQKIRFQLPIHLSQQQLEAIKVNYDKDGWMRCLGQDLKFHWVYNKSDDPSNSKKTQYAVVDFDVENTAYVRQFQIPGPTDPPGMKPSLKFVAATEYAIETSVRGTSVSYAEINSVARLPFQGKVDWLRNQFNALRTPWEEGHMKIKVRRHSLIRDAMDCIEMIEVADMKKAFRFEFIGEPALDAGGVAREFYSCMLEQVCNPDVGLFSYSSANQMCMQFNPNSSILSDSHLKYFHMIGRVIGKSLMDNQITPVHFVQPLYKHIMGWPITLRDLEHVDEEIYRNLTELLNIQDVGSLYLDFVVTEDHLGSTESVDLIPGGGEITVCSENLVQYLEANLHYRLFGRFKEQLSAFLRGFYDVVPEPLLSVFDFQELELLLHGLPNIDMDDWILHSEYTGEFTGQSSHRVVQWFWEVVRSFEHENKARLLQFVTGTAGVPVQGFSHLQGNDGNIRKFTVHGDKNVKIFPRAHTCFNRIDMPIYKSKAELQKYLTMAVSMESTGFDIE